ncbi:hypothetical protein [Brachyspira aalborgi]|uniref:DUF4935 domain-containing protein n=1 Tax=Brachyspira aalborgi TaxID=29522 RepID=A0A5C8G064_9SPIR|nr:hypothetical protein [Brachyspira aalborgi]TXJ55340.1 hypothetical protein EPJ76_07055 [Brachyspira aalborgi]
MNKKDKDLLFIDTRIYKNLIFTKNGIDNLFEKYLVVISEMQEFEIKNILMDEYLKKNIIKKYLSNIILTNNKNFTYKKIKNKLKELLDMSNNIVEYIDAIKNKEINNLFSCFNKSLILPIFNEDNLIENSKKRLKNILYFEQKNKYDYYNFFLWELLLNSECLSNSTLYVYTKDINFINEFNYGSLKEEWKIKQNGELKLFDFNKIEYDFYSKYFYKLLENKPLNETNSIMIHFNKGYEIIDIIENTDITEYNYLKEQFYILNKNIKIIKNIISKSFYLFYKYLFKYNDIINKKKFNIKRFKFLINKE